MPIWKLTCLLRFLEALKLVCNAHPACLRDWPHSWENAPREASASATAAEPPHHGRDGLYL